MMTEVVQNLFTVDRRKYVLAHAIPANCTMKGGIVLEFIDKHPGLQSACIAYSNGLSKKIVGHAFRYQDREGVVYNLFTKSKGSEKVGVNMTEEEYLKNLKKCLNNLKEQMVMLGEYYLAIPLIGCGLDQCTWENVSKVIEKVFKDTDIEILVCKKEE